MGHRARVVAAIVLSVAVLASLGLSGCTREKPAPTDPAWVPPEATAAVEVTPRPLTGGQESSSGGATDATPSPGDAEATEDGFIVTGGARYRGGRTSSQGDHRIAMAAAVAATSAAESVVVDGFDAAAVSWPGFAEALDAAWSSR